MRFFLGLLIFTTACAHKPPAAHGTPPFPFGTYRHHVTVKTPQQVERHIQGVVQMASEDFRITALSPVGTTLFKAHKDLRSGKYHTENFAASISDKQIFHIVDVIQNMMYGGEEFSYAHRDEKNVFRQIQFKDSKAEIRVEVVDYELR